MTISSEKTSREATTAPDRASNGGGSRAQPLESPTPVHEAERGGNDDGAARVLEPLLRRLVGDLPVRLEFWDGSSTGGPGAVATLKVRSRDAVRELLWSPGELGVARAFVAGGLDVDGDLIDTIVALRRADVQFARAIAALPALIAPARRLGLVGRPPSPPPEEARPRGWRHSKRRDAQVVSHHYDVGNDFYSLVLGPSMTYSCARFVHSTDTLEQAQAAKHELVCRKLGLHTRPGKRLLDVGCGWGEMAIHAARHHGAEVVGITISREQADEATLRVRRAGLHDRIEIRHQDYREVRGEQFEAVSSVGMFEHVGARQVGAYFSSLRGALAPRGRLLNHAISTVGGSKLGTRSFMYRYVFPDGELMDVGEVVLAMEAAGFEVRDVESLRESYGRTLRQWVANLQEHWGEATELVGPVRARVWLLYMAACAVGFEEGRLSVHQVLGVLPAGDGDSGMPSSRQEWD